MIFILTGLWNIFYRNIWLHLHLADAFIQSDLQLHSGYTFSSVCVFPENRTHNLLRCWRNALPLSHTGTQIIALIIINIFNDIQGFDRNDIKVYLILL